MLPDALTAAIRSAWSASTAAGDNDWSPTNSSAGHCDVTALVISEHVGGDVRLAQVFRDGELSEHHYWNVLPDETDVDMTREQFDGTEMFGESTRMTPDFFAASGPMQPELVTRLELFRSAVAHHLSAHASPSLGAIGAGE